MNPHPSRPWASPWWLPAHWPAHTERQRQPHDELQVSWDGIRPDTPPPPRRSACLRGGFDYAFALGLVRGRWNSSVDWLSGQFAGMDFYGGYKAKAGGSTSDLGGAH